MYKFRTMKGPGDASAGVIELHGTLDNTTAGELKGAVSSCLKSGAHDLILDFDRVHFMGSAGFAVILGCLEDLAPGGHLLLSRLPDRVLVVADLLGLKPVLDIVADEHEAREFLWGKPT
jgi:anti-anti-sigma factor